MTWTPGGWENHCTSFLSTKKFEQVRVSIESWCVAPGVLLYATYDAEKRNGFVRWDTKTGEKSSTTLVASCFTVFVRRGGATATLLTASSAGEAVTELTEWDTVSWAVLRKVTLRAAGGLDALHGLVSGEVLCQNNSGWCVVNLEHGSRHALPNTCDAHVLPWKGGRLLAFRESRQSRIGSEGEWEMFE